jgi:hypothetical protein
MCERELYCSARKSPIAGTEPLGQGAQRVRGAGVENFTSSKKQEGRNWTCDAQQVKEST